MMLRAPLELDGRRVALRRRGRVEDPVGGALHQAAVDGCGGGRGCAPQAAARQQRTRLGLSAWEGPQACHMQQGTGPGALRHPGSGMLSCLAYAAGGRRSPPRGAGTSSG